MRAFLISIVLILSACAHRGMAPKIAGEPTSKACTKIFYKAADEDTEAQLNSISDLYSLSCFKEVITLGSYLRTQFRSKFYQVSSEVAEIFAPEGSLTAYVLESYERTYLSLLISVSYLGLQDEEAALVELRKAQDEQTAYLYNYGTDPILSLLQASLWDRFDPAMARPHWKFLNEISKSDPAYDITISQFAASRLKEIDQNPMARVRWRIVGIGNFPDLDWTTNFFDSQSNSYKITATSEFPKACANADEVLVPTKYWVYKIGQRYKSDYHPMLYVKSLARFPVAVTYGIVGVSLGIGVGFGGCIISSQGSHAGDLCEMSWKLAGYLINQSGDLVKYIVRPDLRHWSKVPSAFMISRLPSSAAPETCLTQNTIIRKTLNFVQ